MGHSDVVKNLAVSLYSEGLSSIEVVKSLASKGLFVSERSVRYWVKGNYDTTTTKEIIMERAKANKAENQVEKEPTVFEELNETPIKKRPNYRQFFSELEQADGSIAELSRRNGVSMSTLHGWATKAEAEKLAAANGHFEAKNFIITSAQINTPVHTQFMDNLEAFAEETNAEIFISGMTYNKDPEFHGGMGNPDKLLDSQNFDKRVRPYYVNARFDLCEHMEFLANINTSPTAVNPISGFQTYSGEKSSIIGHPKVALESVATRAGKHAKQIFTTGACTVKNFIQKKAGIKAEHFTSIAALFVETLADGSFRARQLIADSETGTFHDLTSKVENGVITHGHRVDCISWGDVHVEKIDPEVKAASWGKGSLSDLLKPRHQMMHDLLDFSCRNHHNRDDALWLKMQGQTLVEGEIQQAVDFLEQAQTEDCKVVVVKSNHDEAYEKWLKEASHYDEAVMDNAIFLLKSQLKIHEEAKAGNRDFDVLEHSCHELGLSKRVKWLRRDETYVVNNVELASHGDVGSNGARGSIKGFAKLGMKHTIGHSHASGIYEGVFQSGVVGKLDMDYNKGGSSWSHGSTLQYESGKRAIVTCVNGTYYGKAPKKAKIK